MKETIKWIVGIIATVLLERLLNLIPFENFFTAEKWTWIIQERFSILNALLFILSFSIIFGIIKISNLRKKRKSKLEKHLLQFNSIVDDKNGVKVTWDMYMGSMYDNDPHPYNIKIFCTKHDVPMLMPHGYCNDACCPNAIGGYQEHLIKNQIESLLLAERDNFTKQNGNGKKRL